LFLFVFCIDGNNQHKIWAAGGKSVFIWEAGWEEPFCLEQFYFQLFQEPGLNLGDSAQSRRFRMVIRSLLPISMETTHDPKEPVLLIALKIMRHAKLCLSVIMFLLCVCWHPERMCWAQSNFGQRGQV
jgi:hypothetical protein